MRLLADTQQHARSVAANSRQMPRVLLPADASNYGTTMVPLDKLFGTYEDGSKWKKKTSKT